MGNDIKLIILVNSKGNKFSHPCKESPMMHKHLKELIKKYNAIYGDTYFIRRCEITREGIKIK